MKASRLILVSLILLLHLSTDVMHCFVLPDPQNVEGQLAVVQTGQINNSTELYFRYLVNSPDHNFFVVETQVEADTSLTHAVTFEVRQPHCPISWQLPEHTAPEFPLYAANHTMCINEATIVPSSPTSNLFTIAVSTASTSLVNFTVFVKPAENMLTLNQSKLVHVSVTSSVTLNFPKHEYPNATTLKVSLVSSNARCMTVSVQEPSVICPVNEIEYSISGHVHYYTMTQRGSVTIEKDSHPNGFLLVLMLHGDDGECNSGHTFNQYTANIWKDVEITVEDSFSDVDLMWSLISPIILYAVVAAMSPLVLHICKIYPWPEDRHGHDKCDHSTDVVDAANYPSCFWLQNLLHYLKPAHIIYLDKIFTSQPPRGYYLRYKRDSFTCTAIVLGIAVYYWLPVLEHLRHYLDTYNKAGNHDLCYYNHDCAYPYTMFGVRINDIFHVYSNIGYIAVGIISICYSVYINKLRKRHKCCKAKDTVGISPNFDISIAISVAIIAEGILSGSYHVCPNRPNFHIDTCCMFVLATLSALKLYQTRHPHVKFSSLNCFMVVIMILDWTGGSASYMHLIILSLVHIIILILYSCQFVTLGLGFKPFMSFSILSQFIHAVRNVRSIKVQAGNSSDLEQSGQLMTKEAESLATEGNTVKDDDTEILAGKDTLIFLLAAWMGNLFLIGFQIYSEMNVGTYLLGILGGNFVIYFIYYILMKIVHGETFNSITIVNLVVAVIFWTYGAMNFKDAKTRWEKSPSESRLHNEECTVLVYDSHDLWHFASSLALFATLNVLHFIDVDLWKRKWEHIPVF